MSSAALLLPPPAASYPELDADPLLRAVRERLKSQYSRGAGYEVRPGGPADPYDLEVCYHGRAVHLYVIHDGRGWEHLCARMERCVTHARVANATAWLAVPRARLAAAQAISDPSPAGPRVCSYTEAEGELYLEWW
jgi:hypothetical protein